MFVAYHRKSGKIACAMVARDLCRGPRLPALWNLDRYCDEFSFRWNLRYASDSERAETAIRQAEGKRLTYKQPMEKA